MDKEQDEVDYFNSATVQPNQMIQFQPLEEQLAEYR